MVPTHGNRRPDERQSEACCKAPLRGAGPVGALTVPVEPLTASRPPSRRSRLEPDLVEIVILDDLRDLFLGERPGGLHGDRLLLTGGEIASRCAHDAVGVDVECDVDLGLALGRGPNALQGELAEQVVLERRSALAL